MDGEFDRECNEWDLCGKELKKGREPLVLPPKMNELFEKTQFRLEQSMDKKKKDKEKKKNLKVIFKYYKLRKLTESNDLNMKKWSDDLNRTDQWTIKCMKRFNTPPVKETWSEKRERNKQLEEVAGERRVVAAFAVAATAIAAVEQEKNQSDSNSQMIQTGRDSAPEVSGWYPTGDLEKCRAAYGDGKTDPPPPYPTPSGGDMKHRPSAPPEPHMMAPMLHLAGKLAVDIEDVEAHLKSASVRRINKILNDEEKGIQQRPLRSDPQLDDNLYTAPQADEGATSHPWGSGILRNEYSEVRNTMERPQQEIAEKEAELQQQDEERQRRESERITERCRQAERDNKELLRKNTWTKRVEEKNRKVEIYARKGSMWKMQGLTQRGKKKVTEVMNAMMAHTVCMRPHRNQENLKPRNTHTNTTPERGQEKINT